MKRGIFVLLLSICLCGCGSNTEEQETEKNNQIVTMEELQNSALESTTGANTEATTESTEEPEKEASPKIAVNTTQETTLMEWDDIRLQSRIFATAGKQLYFCQWAREGRAAELYKGEIGGTDLQKVEVELADGMDIYDMTTDEIGHLYLLLRNKSAKSGKATAVIRELDEAGVVVAEHDISQALQDKISLHQAFLVDGEGNFYIRSMSSAIYIAREGNALWEVKDSENGMARSFGSACGADGGIYLTYLKEDGSYIGKINSEDGSIAEEYRLTEIKGKDQVLALGQGTDCDLLVYGNLSGCWAWNKEDNSMEQRTSLSEAELPHDETIIVRGFLEDGRLLLVKNISQGDELTGRKLEYYPAGK